MWFTLQRGSVAEEKKLIFKKNVSMSSFSIPAQSCHTERQERNEVFMGHHAFLVLCLIKMIKEKIDRSHSALSHATDQVREVRKYSVV